MKIRLKNLFRTNLYVCMCVCVCVGGGGGGERDQLIMQVAEACHRKTTAGTILVVSENFHSEMEKLISL